VRDVVKGRVAVVGDWSEPIPDGLDDLWEKAKAMGVVACNEWNTSGVRMSTIIGGRDHPRPPLRVAFRSRTR
jgi:hypothetical protein